MNTFVSPPHSASAAPEPARQRDARAPGSGPEPMAGAPPVARRVSLTLDPITHEELQCAAGHRDVASYLYVLAGRYARWNELREWLLQLETAYGPLPPEALERFHRQMLGLPRRTDGMRSVSIRFSETEFDALSDAAGDRPLADYLKELLAELLRPVRGEGSSGPAAPKEGEGAG